MTERIIDLRNKGQEAKSDIRAFTDIPKEIRRNSAGPTSEREANLLLEWSAFEQERQNHGPYWFLAMGAAATAFVIFGIFARSYFFIVFTALAFIVLLLYSRREPQKISFAITRKGVQVGSKFYEWSGLKSFWIFDMSDINELSLETVKGILPFIRLPLGETSPEKIKKILQNFLPEEEHKDTASDQIARGLGL